MHPTPGHTAMDRGADLSAHSVNLSCGAHTTYLYVDVLGIAQGEDLGTHLFSLAVDKPRPPSEEQ